MPSSPILVRPATIADAAAIVAFNVAMAMETEGLALDPAKITPGVEGLFAHPQYGFYVVAEADGQAVGGLMITYEWSDWRNAVFWWIQSVYVLPAFRGQGVYRALYTSVKAMAQAAGNCCGFRLYVEKENTAAQAVYRKLGMQDSHYWMFEGPAD
ncbi:MAG: GNAT family N-acetyltransferase [Bryobacter sp.]|nr:GNAT family N-acetyltransferase [Bryobacter sp.]